MSEPRKAKELLGTLYKDATEKERWLMSEKYELNCCDWCGEIDSTYQLMWIEAEDTYYDDPVCIAFQMEKSCSAVCKECYRKASDGFSKKPIYLLKWILDWRNTRSSRYDNKLNKIDMGREEPDKPLTEKEEKEIKGLDPFYFPYYQLTAVIAHLENSDVSSVEGYSEERIKNGTMPFTLAELGLVSPDK